MARPLKQTRPLHRSGRRRQRGTGRPRRGSRLRRGSGGGRGERLRGGRSACRSDRHHRRRGLRFRGGGWLQRRCGRARGRYRRRAAARAGDVVQQSKNRLGLRRARGAPRRPVRGVEGDSGSRGSWTVKRPPRWAEGPSRRSSPDEALEEGVERSSGKPCARP